MFGKFLRLIDTFQTSQGPPPPYPNQQSNNAAASNKRFKQEEVIQQSSNVRPAQPVYYLSQQQLQMLQYLQQNQNNLTAQQQNVLQQLTTQYRLMQQHQQQVRIQQQQRTQPGAVQSQSGQVINRPGGQQFIGQQTNSFQQTTPRVPPSGTIAQTGFAVESSGNFPAATGHTLPNAGMPYKSANVGTFQQNQFGTNLGYTQISSTTTNQSDMGKTVD